jgi:2,4-dienoyl-CoA reductase-like NADH-dependent reductase (Old Yellow Enzyme family)
MARPTDGSAPNPQEPPVGPSGIDPVTLQQTAEPMTLRRIHDIVESFARAAANARRLGFDGVEIQGAHGYLIDQFLWSATNHRDDEYGGDLPRRVRFAREVAQAVRKAVGSKFPILFRLSQWKIGQYDARIAHSADELAEIVVPLSEAGVDIFDCSTQHYNKPEFEGSPRTLAGWVRFLTGRPVISVGTVGLQPGPLHQLARMLSANDFDLIALGRALLADYAWGSKIRSGQDDTISRFTPRDLGHLL